MFKCVYLLIKGCLCYFVHFGKVRLYVIKHLVTSGTAKKASNSLLPKSSTIIVSHNKIADIVMIIRYNNINASVIMTSRIWKPSLRSNKNKVSPLHPHTTHPQVHEITFCQFDILLTHWQIDLLLTVAELISF